MNTIGPGSLKLISAHSDHRSLADVIEQTLLVRVGQEDLRQLGNGVFALYCEASPDEVRDWVGDRLQDGESAFVVEFERWSSRGPAADSQWLLRRGH